MKVGGLAAMKVAMMADYLVVRWVVWRADWSVD
jgi:hypothetical protein